MAYNTEKITNVGALKTMAQELKKKMAAEAANERLSRKIVDSVEAIDLTAADAAQYIYMVPRAGAEDGNKYNEYLVIDGALESVGSWGADLSGYVTEENLDGQVAAKLAEMTATDAEVAEMLAEVFGSSTAETPSAGEDAPAE